MTTLQEQLQLAITQTTNDSLIFHSIIHGDSNTEVSTDNGNIKSISKVLTENQDTLNQSISTITEMRDLALLAADEAINAAEQAHNAAQGNANNIHLSQVNGLTSANVQLAIEELNSIKVNANSLGNSATKNIDVNGGVQSYNQNIALTNKAQLFVKAQSGSVVALTSLSSIITIDLSLSNNFSITMTENSTLGNPSNLTPGQSGQISILQGSSPYSLAFASYWKEVSGDIPAISTTSGAKNIISYYVSDASTIWFTLKTGGVA